MLTNFLLLIILPLCGNRLGLHTALSKHLIICAAFNIQMNSDLSVLRESQNAYMANFGPCQMLFWIRQKLPTWCVETMVWFLPLPNISGHAYGDIDIIYATERLLSNLRHFGFVFSFDFWTSFQKNTLTMLKVSLWFMTFSSYFLVKKCLIHLIPFKINWHV